MLCCCFWRRPLALVTVHLENAHDLKKQDLTGAGRWSHYCQSHLHLNEMCSSASSTTVLLCGGCLEHIKEHNGLEGKSYFCRLSLWKTASILYLPACSKSFLYFHLIIPGADPYCIVKCGRQKAVTPVIKNTLNPTFGTKVNFYISNPAATEVTVQVKRETRPLANGMT